ncbi:hypothetical protein SRHO_G00039140 [Serrasalmus rhombeus]
MPPLHPPMHEMDTSTPTWNEVVNIVKRARMASAPGPNGIPYRLYKNTPGVLKYLWHQMKLPWKKEIIPKAGVGGFSGCLEHASTIWHQLQSSKREKKDLHVVFLDLANAFGSVPHRILWTAFAFFQVPDNITNLVQAYFRDIQFCMTMHESTTAWQQLELGIMARCTISPLAFTLAMELIIRASAWVVGKERVDGGLRLPPIRAYMDDMTTITSTKPCTKRLLEKLQSNTSWAGMKIKPCKSRRISVVKGQITNDIFTINDEPIPPILQRPIKSLGRWYNASLNDTEQIEQLRQDTISGLKQINNTGLPGKLKLWCFQFGLLPRLMWPITIYEVTSSHISRLERLVNAQVRRWLGLPRCMSSVGLYVDGPLSCQYQA